MQALKISDTATGAEYLDFDLRHVLAALGERALSSAWRIEELWVTDVTDAKRLEWLVDHAQPISGRELKDAAENVVQVIDGEFAAFEVGSSEPWVIVEAVDSAYYTVRSNDPDVLQSIRNHFRDVSEYEHPA